MYPKCGNLCGQRGRKRFIASWGLRMSHICPCTPCPSPQGYRSKVESRHFAHHWLEGPLHRCHRLGKGLPGLPAGHGPPPRTGTSATHPSSHPPFQPHLCGPSGLPAGIQGFTYLVTIIDRTSRWPEAIPIAATSTVDCANALIQGWVSRFGVPAVITSDCRT
jgi:hypothetical protein